MSSFSKPKQQQKTLTKQSTKPIPSSRPKLLKTGLWLLLWLVLADISINLLFPFPRGLQQTPNSIERYFDYGRSIEGKLKRMVRQPTTANQSILSAGWVNPNDWKDLPTAPKPGDDLLVSVYGMSFADNIAQQLTKLDDKITLRSIGGPSAPVNHSLATYTADTEGKSADVAILGILASSVKRIHSLSGTNWSYENPTPYTYPYYTLTENNQLTKIDPIIKTADQFTQAITQQNGDWQQQQQQMREYDSPFSAFIFNSNFSDRSALIRLIRRGWANRTINKSETRLYHQTKGFDANASEIKVLKAMLSEFTQTARNAQQTPIVILISDQGYNNHLHEALSPHLNTLDVSVLNTYDIASSNDPTNFIPDGHFTIESDRQLATQLHTLIRQSHSTP